MCFGGGGGGENTAEVARIEADAEAERIAEARRVAEEQRAAEEAERLRKQQEFEDALAASYQAALGDTQNYFSQQGVLPEDYEADITRAASRARRLVPSLSTDIESYFDGLGATLFNDLQTNFRTRSDRALDDVLTDNYASTIIQDTSDDAILQSLYQEQRSEADTLLDRLFARGVLNDSGLNAAQSELDDQGYRARSLLEQLGNATLEIGRGNLRTIGAEARDSVGNLRLGDLFSTAPIQERLNTSANDFFGSLGDQIRAGLTDDLFDVSSAFAAGGVGQGAQNTAFDPNASSGFFNALFTNEEEEEDDEFSLENAF